MKKEIDSRQDLSSEDVDVQRERHPSVRFINIPDAWIIGIDEMLSSMRYGMPLKEVRQFEGMLITVFRDDLEMKNLDRYRTVINKKEQELYSIDMDLHIDQEIDKCLVKCLN